MSDAFVQAKARLDAAIEECRKREARMTDTDKKIDNVETEAKSLWARLTAWFRNLGK